MWDLLNLLGDYWFLIPWILGILIAFRIGGWRAALAVLTLGAGVLAYKIGRRTERAVNEMIVRDIQEKREKAYEEINSRNTSKSDVIDRLRKRSY